MWICFTEHGLPAADGGTRAVLSTPTQPGGTGSGGGGGGAPNVLLTVIRQTTRSACAKISSIAQRRWGNANRSASCPRLRASEPRAGRKLERPDAWLTASGAQQATASSNA